MSQATTILHIKGHDPEAVERALTAIFAAEERPIALRLQGTFSGVLARLLAPDLDAQYRYLILRPHPESAWTPVLELGNRTEGLDSELSRELDGAPVFSVFAYGDAVSGYRLARGGVEVDRYLSDPTYFEAAEAAEAAEGAEGTETNGDAAKEADPEAAPDFEAVRGHPEQFADLLPGDTAPEDFVRVVLRPGWWEDFEAATGYGPAEHPGEEAEDAEGDELVDEVDRMRCIALALELWGPLEYPLTGELEELPNKQLGPGIALAFA